MNVIFDLLIKIGLIMIIGSIVAQSARCPPPDVVKPCTCSESSYSLICIKYNSNDFNSSNNLSDIFETISKSLSPDEDNTFEELLISNTQSLEFEETLFSNITFKKLFIFENNLTKIHSNIFHKTYSAVKDIYMNLNSIKDNQQNYSLFEALSSLTNLETLSLDFGLDSITSLPDNAFKVINGIQTNLREISLNGLIESVGELAFAQLPNLRKLKILDQINTIGEKSLQFNTSSSADLKIDLSYNKLKSNSFEPNSLSNIRRGINLLLNQNRIQYLDQTVFESFFTANENNSLTLTKNPLNCSDCRSFWLTTQMSNLKPRILDPICTNGQNIWDQMLNCNNNQTTTESPNSTYFSLRLSLILSLFVIFKVILI